MSYYAKGVDFTLYDCLTQTDREKIINAEIFYNDVKEKSKTMNVLDILDYIYNYSGYASYILSNDSYADLDEAFDSLYYFASKIEGCSLVSLLFSMTHESKAAASDTDNTETKLTYDMDAVSMMTIHGSKGLEFPIVFIADIARKPRPDEKENFFVQDGKVYTSVHNQMIEDITANKKEREAAEIKRILYVAITRSKNHLVTTAVVNFKKDGGLSSAGKMFDNYIDAFMNNKQIPNNEIYGIKCVEIPTVANSYVKKEFKFPAETEPSVINYGTKCLAVSGKQDDVDEDGVYTHLTTLQSDEILKKYEASNLFGTYVHSLLESKMATKDAEALEITDYKNEKEILERDAASLVNNFLNSDLYNNYIAGSERKAELDIFTQCDGIAYEGIVDLVVFKDDYNLVIDYKTDSYKADQKHKGQVKMYLNAIEDIYSKPAYGMVFYLREENPEVSFIDKNGAEITL